MGWGINDIFYHDFSSTLRHHFECLASPRSTGEQQVAFPHYKGGWIFLEHTGILGKMQRSHFPNTGTRATSIGDLIHTDAFGPMEIMSLGKARYFVLFKDDFSGWCFTAALQTQHKCIARTLRSENGGEYVGKDFDEWLAQKGNKSDMHKTNIIFF